MIFGKNSIISVIMGKERESYGGEDIDRKDTDYSSFCAAFLRLGENYGRKIEVEEWLSKLVESSTEIYEDLDESLATPISDIIYHFIDEGKEKEAFAHFPCLLSPEESQYFAVESLFFIGFEVGSQKFKNLSEEESFRRTFTILKKIRFLNDQGGEFSSKVFGEGVFLGKLLKGGATRLLKTYPFCLN